jgi:hypothetical protein
MKQLLSLVLLTLTLHSKAQGVSEFPAGIEDDGVTTFHFLDVGI